MVTLLYRNQLGHRWFTSVDADLDGSRRQMWCYPRAGCVRPVEEQSGCKTVDFWNGLLRHLHVKRRRPTRWGGDMVWVDRLFGLVIIVLGLLSSALIVMAMI